MKKFNATEAIKGAKVITANNLYVTNLTYFPDATKYKFAGLCEVKSDLKTWPVIEILTWDLEGKVDPNYSSHYDLFMAPVYHTRYADKAILESFVTYNNPEAVKRNNGTNATVIALTWEE